jgi:hypothetical protein
LDLHLETII